MNPSNPSVPDMSNLKDSVEVDPSKAKGTLTYVYGSEPVSGGGTYTTEKKEVQAHIGKFYDTVSTTYPVGLASNCAGCVIVTSEKGKYVLRFLAAPSVVFDEDAVSRNKAYGLVGFTNTECYTRLGFSTKSIGEDSWYTHVSFIHPFNRFRVGMFEPKRTLEKAVKDDYPSSYTVMSNKILKSKPPADNPEAYLVGPSSSVDLNGKITSIALPAFYSIPLGSDFGFISDIEVPMSMAEAGKFETSWKAFQKDMIEKGCHENSPFLNDSFFKLWVWAVVTSPKSFETKCFIRQFHNLSSIHVRNAAFQTAQKAVLDYEWMSNLHGKGKEACALLAHVLELEKHSTVADWGNEVEVEGNTFPVTTDFWSRRINDLPSPTKSFWVRSCDVITPPRSRQESQPTTVKQPRSLFAESTASVPVVSSFGGLSDRGLHDDGNNSGDSQLSLRQDKSHIIPSVVRYLESLLALSIRPLQGNDPYIKKFQIDQNDLHVLNVSTKESSILQDRNWMFNCSIKKMVLEKGSKDKGLQHHSAMLGWKQGLLAAASIKKDIFFNPQVFGLFLEGVWELEELQPSRIFQGYTPLMCLLLLPFCEVGEQGKIKYPILPASGFQVFNDVLLFLEAVRDTFSHFVNEAAYMGGMPLLVQGYEYLLTKLQESELNRCWSYDWVDRPKISFLILQMVHNFFAQAAFIADHALNPSYKLFCADSELRPIIPSAFEACGKSLDRYLQYSAFTNAVDDLITSFRSALHNQQFSPSTHQSRILHFLFKSEEPLGDSKKRKEYSDSPREKKRITKLLQAVKGTEVLHPQSNVSIVSLEHRFGPGEGNNPNVPKGGKGRGKSSVPSSLCIRFLLGEHCDPLEHRKPCGYHLCVTSDSINGSAKDYAIFRDWCKRNASFVKPSRAALNNPTLFPDGRL